jgi:hypothetical protein
VGSQDHAVLYYATVHAHPLVGGYVSRMLTAVALSKDGHPEGTRLVNEMKSWRTARQEY